MRLQMLMVLLASLSTIGTARSEVRSLSGHGEGAYCMARAEANGRIGDTLQIGIQFGFNPGIQRSAPRVTLHLAIPDGINATDGDTVVAPPAGVDGQHLVRYVPRTIGTHMLRGVVEGGTSARSDRIEWEMPIEVRSDTVIVGKYRDVSILVRAGGQRYRYADTWLIPIDSTEAGILESDIDSNGERARVIRQENATCRRCPQDTVVTMLVVIDRNGRIRESLIIPHRSNRRWDSESVRVAQEALGKWQFKAARWNDERVSDYIVVRVPIRTSK